MGFFLSLFYVFIITKIFKKCNNGKMHKIMGFLLAKFCATFCLTKYREVWYNGNSARGVRPRAAAFVKYNFSVSAVGGIKK